MKGNGKGLALGELEVFAGAGLAVFLSLNFPCIPGQKPGFLQRSAVTLGVDHAQRSGDAVFDSVSLSGNTTTAYIDQQIVFSVAFDDL